MFYMLYNFGFHVAKLSQTIINRNYVKTCKKPATTEFLVPVVEIKRFVMESFYSVGVNDAHSTIMADSLILADSRGVKSEGIDRLRIYINDILSGICDPKAIPTVESESGAVATVNGNDGLGPVTGKFCMDLAIDKALQTGIGMVAAKGSNHFGMASLYTIQAVDKGYIGLSMSNSYPVMVPPGGINAAIGANPISLGAPAHCDDLIFDMATTATTIAKIKRYEQMHMELPLGWALNDKGQIERSARSAMMHKKLCPLGVDQSHKGFGLGLLVEVLSGILADSNYGTDIPEYSKQKCPPDLGHSFIALNPEKFVPNFATRLSKFLKRIRSIDSTGAQVIFVPGDKQRNHMKKIECDGGFRLSKRQIDFMENFAQKFRISPLEYSVYTKDQMKSDACKLT